MSYLDAKEYFKHYIEGVDFTDGISSKDITRRGARENFAESYSTIFDENPSEVNGIYASIFSNSRADTLFRERGNKRSFLRRGRKSKTGGI